MASSPPSYYTLLQVPQSASPQELRQAFRGLSKRYHPDTTVLPAGEAALAFQQLQQAYGVHRHRRSFLGLLRCGVIFLVASGWRCCCWVLPWC